MKISRKVKKAMDKAEKQVRREALKPKKRRRIKKTAVVQQTLIAVKWIKDEWGKQEEVFFDGYRYWGSFLELSKTYGNLNVISRCWSIEKWEERKKKQETVVPNLETTETEKPLSSTPKIMKSTNVSKREPKRKSLMKSGETATQPKQKKWQWTSTSLERKKIQ